MNRATTVANSAITNTRAPAKTYLRLEHDLGQLAPLLGGEALLLEFLKAVSEPLPLPQAAQLAGFH